MLFRSRVERLRQFAFPAVSALVVTRVLIVVVAIAAATWFVRSGVFRRAPAADNGPEKAELST